MSVQRPESGDLVKVFSSMMWYERRGLKKQGKEWDKPFQLGMFLDDYYMEPDDEERMGDWYAIVLLNGEEKHIRARDVETFNA